MPLEGDAEAFRNLEGYMRRNWSRVGVAWWDCCQAILAVSVGVECPVKTGALRSTAENRLSMTDTEIVCTLGYGSEAVKYAFVQHERLDFYHTPPTKAKYLEDPANRMAPDLPHQLLARLLGVA